MTDQDFDTIYAIVLEAPKRIGLMIASTPTGRRGAFYKICTQMNFNMDKDVQPVNTKELGYVYDTRKYDRQDAEGWKEFHIPSMANPEWSPAMERELKIQFSEVAYEHEVLAEFGTETIGVFNKDFVDEAASKGYVYEERAVSDAPIAIGVDWDKFGATTNIVVLKYDAYDQRRSRPEIGEIDNGFGRFKVINRIEIPKSDMQYDVAVRTIMKLDQAYRPFAIYADRGAGEYQLEILRKSLGEKVKGVFYGSSKAVRDPLTKVIEKKPLKPFLINQTTLLLERGQIRIPERTYDEVIHRQMTNFQVVSVSQKTQEPTYTNVDEHSLDAMIFALYAFYEDYPELMNTVFNIEVNRKAGLVRKVRKDPFAEISRQNFTRNSSDQNWDEPGSPPPKRVPIGFAKRRGSDNLSDIRRSRGSRSNTFGSRF